ncbi:hypothetical protein ACFQ61_09740 [Streptomyces sp. NPDC056500]|uniref:hypothetical protein n=1 Tax=Streptomyces sp. NPDC056500 TaxID=3345840 RepID=UPI0036AE90D3
MLSMAQGRHLKGSTAAVPVVVRDEGVVRVLEFVDVTHPHLTGRPAGDEGPDGGSGGAGEELATLHGSSWGRLDAGP